MIATSNAYTARAATPKSWRNQIVAEHTAEMQMFDISSVSRPSSRLRPVASTVVVVDCSKGGEPR